MGERRGGGRPRWPRAAKRKVVPSVALGILRDVDGRGRSTAVDRVRQRGKPPAGPRIHPRAGVRDSYEHWGRAWTADPAGAGRELTAVDDWHGGRPGRSEEHTSELQSLAYLV